MEYKVVHAGFIDKLEETVRLHIKDGWKPLGGMVAYGYEYIKLTDDFKWYSKESADVMIKHNFCQTLVREV
jgi:hypothetical protein